ncbi:thiamine transporter 2 [Fopius arisanus]|uniref:Thiamine transporter 2 n=2 Tax=Fopius arisanus TaxID=64838 RepID=A0A9R1T1Y4_9HYME|nr:PREDICTED: thiamine transporter 2-like [Fopius arisanus]
MDWVRISQILCMFGFLKEFRPGEPFITDYLTSEWKNFTSEQVTEDIYPVGTYSYCATLVVIFLLTDFLRYKPIIILCGLSGIIAFCTLTFGKSLGAMQFLEFMYGFYLSTDVAYYTYIYAKVDKKHYEKVSSYTRSAFLFGRFFASTVSQLIISYQLMNYHQLNFLTIAGQVLATIWALFLPPVKQSVYFHRPMTITDGINNSSDSSSAKRTIDSGVESSVALKGHQAKPMVLKIKSAYYLLWKDFLKAYTSFHVLKWSLWWAAASCGYLQVLSYSQPVWQTAVKKDDKIYNGAVEALYSIIGAAAVFAVGRLRLNWEFLGEAVLVVFTFVEAFLLFVTAHNYNIWVLYTLYIIFGVIYHTIVTVASFEVAKKISEDSYGLVFGINILVSLIFQTILTYIVTSGRVFKLDIRQQFVVYAWYFVVLAIFFIPAAIITIIKSYRRGAMITAWAPTDNSSETSGNQKIEENSS